MNVETLNTIANWVLMSAFPAVILFPILYSRSDWKATLVA